MLEQTAVSLAALTGLLLTPAAFGQDRVPGETWMRFSDPADAGFDAAQLEAARAVWSELPSSAFMVVADGAVVAAWGDVERRFMCHSVRKSFLAALYGIYWDRGEIELNRTLADLELDDEPDPLLETEKRARILDLLKARSGVFHPAAYAGRTDSRPRGSEGPGRYFAYNNWDFNTLATILMQETGDDLFESFDEHFGQPLGMQDWRVSDGYYHYERDKSKYPAYPFRMSARDAARFGLLFTRRGAWGDSRILSKHWVDRCGALYSIDDERLGYGFMWWIYREPRFAEHGMVSALGVGNQMIAALPESDLVIVNRANTFDGESTPLLPLLDLIEQVLEARTGVPVAEARLEPLEAAATDPRLTHVDHERLSEFVGEWSFPPPSLGPAQFTTAIRLGDGHLVSYSEVRGTLRLYLQEDGTLVQEDSYHTLYPVRQADGALEGLANAASLVSGALAAAGANDREAAERIFARLERESGPQVQLGRALAALVFGETQEAEGQIRKLAEEVGPNQIEAQVNVYGYELLGAEKHDLALRVFELNTRVFPEAFNTWDSLGEMHMNLGNDEEAIRYYERSLELNPDNQGAHEMIERIRG